MSNHILFLSESCQIMRYLHRVIPTLAHYCSCLITTFTVEECGICVCRSFQSRLLDHSVDLCQFRVIAKVVGKQGKHTLNCHCCRYESNKNMKSTVLAYKTQFGHFRGIREF